MPGKHSLKARQAERTAYSQATDLFDAQTGQTHLLTDGAVAAGRLPKGRYIAICGQEVLPVSLSEHDDGYCPSCASFCTSIPTQRSKPS